MPAMTPHLFPPGVPVQKRLFDLLLTIPGVVLALPLLGLLALLALILQGRPVFYRQARGGLGNSVFSIYKFRTMRTDYEENGQLKPDGERMTVYGRFLRATSLDELPELFNVLRGEMSLVGPRPLMAVYLDRYTPEQARRHAVLPGITGWAQVNGRNALTWEDKFALDLWYVDHWSLGLDVKILAQTFSKVSRQEGINQPGQATAEEFKGTSDPARSRRG